MVVGDGMDDKTSNKARNAVVIIILCLIGAGVIHKSRRLEKQPNLAMPGPSTEDLKDGLAGHRVPSELEKVLFGEPDKRAEPQRKPEPPRGSVPDRQTIYGNGDHKFEMPEQQRPPELEKPEQLSPSGPQE